MGAGHSAEGSQGPSKPNHEIKTSYYELLGVDKQATDDEIKKAYRRKALTLHPDRNYGDVERTTALFASVQSAYEVLSDPQERAWYDSHEAAILRDIDPTTAVDDEQGGASRYEHDIGLTTADDVTRLIRRFHGGTEFTDAPSGFFGFLREFFDKLAKEERNAALLRQDRDGDYEEIPDYPSFGHSADTHEDVAKPFYAVWLGFSTAKTFTWRDKYRPSDAEDRRTRRLIEKENARFRREGMAEFNESVRVLVAFVRKRDPRVKASGEVGKTDEERVRVLRDGAAAQAARMRAANLERAQAQEVPAWARAPAASHNVDENEGLEGKLGEESSSEEEHFECMACRKTFKSERQFEAHERSKKHVKAVQALRRKLEKEGHVFGVDDEEEEEDRKDRNDDEPEGGLKRTTEDEVADEDARVVEIDGSEHLETKGTHDEPGNDAAIEDHDGDDDDMKKTFPTPEQTAARPEPASDESDDSHDSDSVADKNGGTPTSNPTSNSPLRSPSNDPTNTDTDLPSDTANLSLSSLPTSATPPPPTTKQGAAALKRKRKAASATASKTSAAEAGKEHSCTVCAAAFPNKSRLFQHVRDFGHARAPAASGSSGGGKKGKRKG